MSGYSKDRIDKCCQLMFNLFKKKKTEKLIYENPAEDLSRPLGEDGTGRPENRNALFVRVQTDRVKEA